MKTEARDKKQYFVVLEINDVSAQDGGNYKVTAKNALGESNATIKLNFDSKSCNPINKLSSFAYCQAFNKIIIKAIF